MRREAFDRADACKSEGCLYGCDSQNHAIPFNKISHFSKFMKSARLNRLFNPKSKRCFDVAIDHGFFNEHDFLSGIENMRKTIDILVAAAPDAIQLTVGLAPLLQELPGRYKPSLVLRTDVANVYGKDLPRTLFSRMIQSPVEQALRLDATCVVVNLFRIPNQPEITDQCIGTFSRSSRNAIVMACR